MRIKYVLVLDVENKIYIFYYYLLCGFEYEYLEFEAVFYWLERALLIPFT